MKERKVLELFAFLEGEVDKMGWGTLSGNVLLVNGVPKLETLNIVSSKRLKFPLTSPASVIETYTIII